MLPRKLAAAPSGNSNTIPTFVSPVIRRDSHRPSLCYLDITFLDGKAHDVTPDLDVIIFQNYYTASISVNMQSSPSTFVPILESKTLMPNPHRETGGQTWFTISASEFNDKYEKGRTLRIMLIQPATVWNTFEIRNCSAIGKAPGGDTSSKLTSITVAAAAAASAAASSSSLTALFRQDLLTLKAMVAQCKLLEQESAAPLLQQDATSTKTKPRKARKKSVPSSSFSMQQQQQPL